jgi:1,5-anhydro-D-fructose reductase (1,5-anhydro-D-mannitol-forming)
MTASTVRFGILGTSGHASRVAAPVLKRNRDVNLLGAAGSTGERSAQFAQQHGLPRSYRDPAELLSDRDIDAVWICSPNHLHAEQVAQCAAAGKHVLVEKPLATTRAEAERAVKIAGQAAVTLRVGCQHRFRPAHRQLREWIASGLVGRVGYFRIHRFWRYPYFEDMDPTGPPEWRRSGEKSGGWVINDIGSHLLDLMFWICGAQPALAGAQLASQQFKLATEDSVAVLVRLGDSAIGIMEASCANDSPGSRIEVYGSAGWIRADDTLSGAARLRTHEGRALDFAPVEMLDTYGAEIADFVAALRGQPSIGADGAAGAELVGIIEDAVRGKSCG